LLELADTSAWHVSRRAPDLRVTFDDQLKAGEVATCDMVKLELLRGARNPEWRRALDDYEEVCRSGPGNDYHRGVSHPDLLIAAAAEAAGVSLVHYDEDFDTIASVTGQPMRWLAPRGSL
jgi:predicted nucleic acid-binding protein